MSRSLKFLIFLASAVLVALLAATYVRPAPLDVFDGCPITGAARSADKMSDNQLKNRYDVPVPSDFEATVSLGSLLRARGQSDFDDRKAVRLSGFVREVKSGGVESCNCRSTKREDMDTHIELVPEAGEGLRGVVVCEVTPRTRFLAGQKGLDWSTEALRRDLVGKRVEVEGWLYYDPDHIEESFANDPDDTRGKPNWRGTCWEVHPVTSLSVQP